MRSIVCHQFAPLSELQLEERPSPDLFPGSVRIAVTACGVNFVDALFVQGKYQIKPPTPFVPGMEVVGRITEVAPDVSDVALGTRVFANVGLGGFSSEAVVPAKRIMKLPDTLSDGQAATFMQSYLTAWFALVERAHVERSDDVQVWWRPTKEIAFTQFTRVEATELRAKFAANNRGALLD